MLKDLEVMVALLKFAAPQLLKSFNVVLLSVIPKWKEKCSFLLMHLLRLFITSLGEIFSY